MNNKYGLRNSNPFICRDLALF